MSAVALSDLRTAVRQRADLVNSQFITDAELNSYINNSYQELYELLISRYEDYNEVWVEFDLATGQDGYTLPSDLLKMTLLERQIVAGATESQEDWYVVHKFNKMERNRFALNYTANILNGAIAVAYRLRGDLLQIIPANNAPGHYRLSYTPALPTLVNDSDTVPNYISNSAWHEYVIVDAAIKCLQKEESDTGVLLMQKQSLQDRILAMASNRDSGEPERVSDIQSANWWNDWFHGGSYR